MAEKKRKKHSDLTPKKQRKFHKVMKEFAERKLHHGSTGKIVTDRNVAVAIAFSESEAT